MSTLPSNIEKLLKKALAVGKSKIPARTILDLLAMEDGDISLVVNKFKDLTNRELRQSFHNMAQLLAALEKIPTSAKDAKNTSSNSVKDKNAKSADDGQFSLPDPSTKGDLVKAKNIKIFTDASVYGNPGPAVAGFAFTDVEGRLLYEETQSIGNTTNNVAEYTALIEAMKKALAFGKKRAYAFSDSELMVNQVNGSYRIKTPHLLPLIKQIMELRKQFEYFQLTHIPREKNQYADGLVSKKMKALVSGR